MVLRIIQGPARQGVSPIRLVLATNSGRVLRSAKATAVSMPDDGLMREWYLESYRHQSGEAVSGVGGLIRQKMAAAGVSLFERVFQSSDEGRRIWSAAAARMAALRVEIYGGGSTLPWEQLRADFSQQPLGLGCRGFVYKLGDARRRGKDIPFEITIRTRVVRILLAICRPGLYTDVDFRAVARLLIDNPVIGASSRLQFEVLRPPTFQRLNELLRAAAHRGMPYHIVHFDGHGV